MKKRIPQQAFFRGTKALVMGIGLHGGGVATVKWLSKNGARVTATDMRPRSVLATSLRALSNITVSYKLGKHDKKDFRVHDLVVVNPGVPRESKYLAIATNARKRIENDTSLFFRFTANPVIAVTGTRGKTTTTLWIAEFLKRKYPLARPSGNTPDNALLKEFERVNKKNIPVVAELSSWQLEYLPVAKRGPHIGVITNIYPDHLNRYKDIRHYAGAKANIFKDQHADDFLVLNHDNPWTKFFLAKHPKSLIFFISRKELPAKLNGLFVRGNQLIFRFDTIEQKLFSVKRFINERGVHNLENLLAAVLATKLFDPMIVIDERAVLHLPTPPMRQEVVYKKWRLEVVNDSCATSPDGTIAAIRRFAKEGNIVLISGGTDKELEFTELAKEIKKYIPREQLILLEGSATAKLVGKLKIKKSEIKTFSTLKACVHEAFAVAQKAKGKTTILFSPGAASFEKFLHEFDRGAKFNKLVSRNIS